MKIIMNPPYNRSMHLKVLDKVTKVFSDADIVSLQPIIWLQSLNRDLGKWQHLYKQIYSIDRISADDNREAFESRGPTDLGIFVIRKDKQHNEIDPFYLSGLSDIDKSIWTKVSKRMPSTFDKHIVWSKPLEKFSVCYSHMCGLQKNSHNFVYVDGKAPDGTTYKENVKNQHKNDFPRTHFEFDTYEEAEHFRQFLWTKFFRYIERITQPGTLRMLELLPYMIDYELDWSDESLYSYFELSKEERDAIERRGQKQD